MCEINVLTSNLTTLACQLLCESHHYPKISYMSHNDNNSGLSALTLSWQGYKNDDFGRGGGIQWPPLKSVQMKLQRHVRGQNRGS